ncbi:MAG: Fe-S-containing protein [Bacteroidota bacterium]
MATERERKRAQFTGGNARKGGGKGRLFLVLAVVLIAGAAGYWAFLRPEEPASGYDPVEQDAYGGGYVSMTDITVPTAVDGKITLPLATINEKKLIWFAYGAGKTPVLAYVAPSGKIITAISMCEPCRSERFHIEGDELVCNACGTRWTLEDLQGISGGCPEYPPEKLENSISGDQVLISEKAVLTWKPRV